MKQAKQTLNGNSKSKNKIRKAANADRTSANRPAAGTGRTLPSPARKRIPRPPALPRISSYAVSLLNRKSEDTRQSSPAEPAANPPASAGNRHPQRDWLTTSEASRLSGYSIRHIQNLCELGFFREGEEWKQRLPRPGISRRGRILIRFSAIKKLDGLEE